MQHKPPGRISHEGGAAQLLDFLKTRVQSPTLAEAWKTIGKFSYQVRRGESMNAWIVRHDEALYEVRRTLAEAIQEYAPVHSVGESSMYRGYGKRSTTTSMAASCSGSRRDDSPPWAIVPLMTKVECVRWLATQHGLTLGGTITIGGGAVMIDGANTNGANLLNLHH